jgi:hypothetical protein
MEKYRLLEKDWPEEQVFNFGDLVEFYKNFALKDERIKEFVERIKEYVEQMNHQPLHYFQLSQDDNYCVLIFDTERNGKSFDIIVKDLSINKLMPVIILNAQDEIAFDKH